VTNENLLKYREYTDNAGRGYLRGKMRELCKSQYLGYTSGKERYERFILWWKKDATRDPLEKMNANTHHEFIYDTYMEGFAKLPGQLAEKNIHLSQLVTIDPLKQGEK
jgi:hypothetical protein